MEARAPSPVASSIAAAAARSPKRSREPEADPAPDPRRSQPLTPSPGLPASQSLSQSLSQSIGQPDHQPAPPPVRLVPDGAPPPPSFLHSQRSAPAFVTPAPIAAFAHPASRAQAADGGAAAGTDAPAAPARLRLLGIPAQARSEADYRAWFQSGGTLAGIPDEERDNICCRIAIQHAPRSLEAVPWHLRSLSLCLEAVSRDGYALADVPGKFLAPGSTSREWVCQVAYESPRPPRIQDVPADLLTPARCLQSLRWAPGDLRAIPEALRTSPVCVAAIRHLPPEFPLWLDDIPVPSRDERVTLALIQRGKGSTFIPRQDLLSWMPPEVRTERVQQAFLLAYPQELQEKKWLQGPPRLSLLAQIMETNPEGLRKLRAQALVDILMEAAAAEGLEPGQALPPGRWTPGLLPADLSALQVTRWAIALSGRPSLDAVPEALREDEAICWQAQRFNKRQTLPGPALATSTPEETAPSLRTLPEDARTLERCKRAVARRGRDYLFVPERHRSWSLLRTALETDSELLHWLPEHEVTAAVCNRALLEAGLFPNDIPSHVRDTAFFQQALRRLPALRYKPQALAAAIADFPDGPLPDALTTLWIEKLIRRDTMRLLDIPRWFNPEWAVRGFRLGIPVKQVQMRLDPGQVPDFLAEIGPFAEAMEAPVRSPRADDAGGAGGSSTTTSSTSSTSSTSCASSSSSSAAASRPS